MATESISSGPILLDKTNVRDFLDSFDILMTDCDGVLWASDGIIDRANLVINMLRQLGKKIFLVTNNSTKSREEYAEKCAMLGFEASKEEIVSSARLLALYLQRADFKKKVYLIGSLGVAQELDAVDIQHIGVGPDPLVGSAFDLLQDTKLDPDVGAVVVAFDGHISLPKILKAASYINSVPDCLFLASNTDESFPVSGTDLTFPGTGCMVSAVEAVVGRQALVMGKPEPSAFKVLRDEHGLQAHRTVMVGDRCNTDILLGNNCGLSTLLVLTGVHQLKDVQRRLASHDQHLLNQVPRYYVPSLGTLLDLLE